MSKTDIEKLFNQFCDANSFQGILSSFRDLCCKLGLQDTHYEAFYPALKEALTPSAPRKWTELRKLLDERASMTEYAKQNACANRRVCIIGAGPVGLRTAVEAALLGAKVDVLEKRTTFSRNNVLKLWQFTIADLKKLGAKRFYPRFCFGTTEHISESQLKNKSAYMQGQRKLLKFGGGATLHAFLSQKLNSYIHTM